MINMVLVGNPLLPFCCILGKDALWYWSWQAVLNFNHISINLQADSNILASPEAGLCNCLPYVQGSPYLWQRTFYQGSQEKLSKLNIY